MKKIIFLVLCLFLWLNNSLYACEFHDPPSQVDGLHCVGLDNFMHIVCPNCLFGIFYVRLSIEPPHEMIGLKCVYCGWELKITKGKE